MQSEFGYRLDTCFTTKENSIKQYKIFGSYLAENKVLLFY